jgi:hypothetical protein
VRQGSTVVIPGPVPSGQTAGVDAGLAGLAAAELQSVRIRVDGAAAAQ